MTDDLHSAVLAVLATIAPEADLDALDDTVDLREELDLDSIDFLNFLVGLHDRLGVDVPESDAPRCSTVAGCVAYLETRVGP